MPHGIVGTTSGKAGLVAVRRTVGRLCKAAEHGAFLWELGLRPTDGLRAWRLLQQVADLHGRSVAWVLHEDRAQAWSREVVEGAWLCATIAPAAFAGFAWDPPSDADASVYAFWDGLWSWLGVPRDPNTAVAVRRAYRRATRACQLGTTPAPGAAPYVYGFLAHGGLSPRFFPRIATLLCERGPAALEALARGDVLATQPGLPALCTWWFSFLREQRPAVWAALCQAWRLSAQRMPHPDELDGVPLLGEEPRRTKWLEAIRKIQLDAKMGYASTEAPEGALEASLALRRRAEGWELGVRLPKDASLPPSSHLVRTPSGPVPLFAGHFYAQPPASAVRLETLTGEVLWGPVELPAEPWVAVEQHGEMTLLPPQVASLRLDAHAPAVSLCVVSGPAATPRLWADGEPVAPATEAPLAGDPAHRKVWSFVLSRAVTSLRVEVGSSVREFAVSDAPRVRLAFESRPWRAWVDGRRWYPTHPFLHLQELASGWERALSVAVRSAGAGRGAAQEDVQLRGEALAGAAWADGGKVVVDLMPLLRDWAAPGLYEVDVRWRGTTVHRAVYGFCGELVVQLPKQGEERARLELNRNVVQVLRLQGLRWRHGPRSNDDFSLLLELLDTPSHVAQAEAETAWGRLRVEVPTGRPGVSFGEVDGQWTRPQTGTTCIGLEEVLEAAAGPFRVEVFGAPGARVRFVLNTSSVRVAVPAERGYVLGQAGRLVFTGEALRDLVEKLRGALAASDLERGAYARLSLEMTSKGETNVVETGYELCHTSTSAPPRLTVRDGEMVLAFDRVARAVRAQPTSAVRIWIHRAAAPDEPPVCVAGTCTRHGPSGAVVRWPASAAGQRYRDGEVYGFRVRDGGFPPRRVTWWRWQPPRWQPASVDEAASLEVRSMLEQWGGGGHVSHARRLRTREEAVAALAEAVRADDALWRRLLGWALERAGDEPITLTPAFEALCTAYPAAFVFGLVEAAASGKVDLPEHWLHPLAERTRLAWRLSPVATHVPKGGEALAWPLELPHAVGAVEHLGAPWRLVWLSALAHGPETAWTSLGLIGRDDIGHALAREPAELQYASSSGFEGAVEAELRRLERHPLDELPDELKRWIRRKLHKGATTRKGIVSLGMAVGRHVEEHERRSALEHGRALLDAAARCAPTVLQVGICLGELAAFRKRSA